MSIETRSSTTLQVLTLVSTGASGVALASAIATKAESVVTVMCAWSTLIIVTAAGALWLRRYARATAELPAVGPLLLLLVVVPLLYEAVQRAVWEPQQPLEIALLCGIQLAACGMSATSCWTDLQPLSIIASLFTVLFAASISAETSTVIAVSIFAASSLGWLVGWYWSSLSPQRNQCDQRLHPERSRWFSSVPLLAVIFLLVMVALLGVHQSDQMLVLAGCLPSSGGDGDEDHAANRGVGNGESLVSGEDNIQSFGPIEDAPFRASEDPSLYDLFNDQYEEPFKIKSQARSIALPADLKAQVESRMANSQRAGKEFSTARKQRTRPADQMSSLMSDALFYVKGRVPLHLRMELFDLFDGVNWHAELRSPDTPPLQQVKIGERSWFCWPQPLLPIDVFSPSETHALKVVHLRGNQVPTPLHFRGVHVDHVDQSDFFQTLGDHLVGMTVTNLPELTSVHLRSQVLDPGKLASLGCWSHPREKQYLSLPGGVEFDRLQILAKSWTVGTQGGRSQIEAIVGHLKSDYQLDSESLPPSENTSPVTQFLFESKRGPDFQFATAAALLLRSLGYPTRLVGGFYASPQRYDHRLAHTTVVGQDAHIWLEVYASSGIWLTVDPSPGYDILEPPPNWWQQSLATLHGLVDWIVQRVAFVTVAGLTAVSLWVYRARAMNASAVAIWWLFPGRNARGRIRQTMRLLELRLWLFHCPRGPGETWTAVFARLADICPGLQSDGIRFAELADWAAFAADSEPLPAGPTYVWSETCRRVIRSIRLTRHSRRGHRAS